MTFADQTLTRESSAIRALLIPVTGVAMLLSAAIFGFFYAWVCSTMWGLDRIDPRAAIEAMNGMNESVRNAVFAPAFFGTPIALLLVSGLSLSTGHKQAAMWFGGAGLLYILGAFLVTMNVNVPMNRAMIDAGVPETLEEARSVWEAYSAKWQVYNILRTVVSGVVFLMGLVGVTKLVKGL